MKHVTSYRNLFHGLLGVACVTCVACNSTGQGTVSYPAYAVGSANNAFDVTTRNNHTWHVMLDRAIIVFGPVYFCASSNANAELCSVAVQEIRGAAEIDALSAVEQPIGIVNGIKAEVRSAIFDYGVTWPVYRTKPFLVSGSMLSNLPDAGLADGGISMMSGYMKGSAVYQSTTVQFDAALILAPTSQGAHVVNQRSIPAGTYASNYRLIVHFDPTLWFKNVDFDAISSRAINGFVSLAADPEVRAIINAMTTGDDGPPSFEWQPQ